GDIKVPKPRLLRFLGKQWPLILATCVGTGLAHVPTTTMPFQIGALMDFAGRSAGQAGLFGFCQIGALAIGMMLISSRLGRVSAAPLAMSGALLAAAANAGLFFLQAFPLQLLLGGLGGVAFGCVFAATIAGAARCDEADRLYGIGTGGGLLLIMLITAAVPVIAGRFGPRSIFLSICCIAVIAAAMLFGLERGRRSPSAVPISWRTAGVPPLLFSWAALSMGTGALYSFSERIGRQIHLEPKVIGAVLSAGLVVGLLGTALAAFFAGRVRRSRALVVGMVGTGLSCLVVGYSDNLALFVAGEFSYMLSYMFLYCYLLGTAARLDATGRVGSLGGGLERLSYSVGVWIGGFLAQYFGYSMIGILGFTGCMAGLVFGFPSLFRALQRQTVSIDGSLQPVD
ncbi:MAG: major facilitator superfamily 1, partial [Gammaproteobacteria bacterium]|nr:major facilitator superfamily 1 [Gammaproteobacteria bacterium]